MRQLLNTRPPGLVDLIPGYTTLLIEFNPRQTSAKRIKKLVDGICDGNLEATAGKHVQLEVIYDGPDLLEVAAAAGLTIEEVVHRHAAPEYLVYAIGFTPGFPFLGEVDPSIRMPRLGVPRRLVPAGSVGIADAQTGIYPLASPGGWRILGRTTQLVYDPHRMVPFLAEPGDSIRFIPVVTRGTPSAPTPIDLLPPDPRIPVFRVQRPGLLDLVLDEGRLLVGRFGLARSGPVDAASARIAAGLVGNLPSDPCLEVNLLGPTLEALRDIVVAFAGAGVVPHLDGAPAEIYKSFMVRRGQILTFPPGPAGCRGYLAVAGGIESSRFFGSASVDSRGLIGRPLKGGDLLGVAVERAALPGFSFHPHTRPTPEIALRLHRGPQYHADLMSALCAHPLRIEHSDRMGVRLAGTRAKGSGVTSEGNPMGAVQLTGDGHPIILLNDRGTMGGYMKPAIVDSRDLGKLAQARNGDWVRFVPPVSYR